MTITAGNSTNGTSADASGTNGGVAIYADVLNITTTGSLSVYGGDGGNGATGSPGSNGRDADKFIGKAAKTGETEISEEMEVWAVRQSYASK